MEGHRKDVVPSLILPGFWLEKVPVQAEGQLEWDFNMKGIFSLYLPKSLCSFKTSLLPSLLASV